MRLLSFAALFLAACGSTSTTNSVAPVAPDTQRNDDGDASVDQTSDVVDGATAEVDRLADLRPAQWTGAFLERSVLLADVIRIEGPVGLLDHVAAASDDDLYIRSLETTTSGLLQIIEVRPPSAPLVVDEDAPVVRAQLDQWSLAAVRKIVLLERVTPGPVVITASNQAFYRDINGKLSRADRLEFVGEIGNMTPLAQLDAGADEATETSTTEDSDVRATPQEDGDADVGADVETVIEPTDEIAPVVEESESSAVPAEATGEQGTPDVNVDASVAIDPNR